MYINIYKDKLTSARLFGKEVLYTQGSVFRDEVPEGWYCYDLCGTDRKPDQPVKLTDSAVVYRVGTILSPQPLKRASTVERKVKDLYLPFEEPVTLAEFCREQDLPLPQDPRKYIPRPASPEEAGLFYALSPEKDEELGAIGHVRIDFGSSRKSFHHSWWPRGPKERNSQEFKAELQEVVDELRKSVLKSLGSMRGYCYGHGGESNGGSCCQNYGYVVETDRYLYRLRCNPIEGDYQAYLSCFDKQAQTLGLTEKGRQALKDAADPGKAHTYRWYVIDRIDDPALRKDYEVTLEEAPRVYAGLDKTDRRLGVLKDGIAAVDLAISWNGREWFSDDWTNLDSFKDDPVIAEAVSMLQSKLDIKPLVGRVTFANGERIGYTDPEEYVNVVKEELPYHATSGFRYETLTDDPEVRKAVDDILHDLYGEENPRPLADYGSGGMTMGGM
nr:LPD28 domain-containing protein [uncultured Oscillibacter sp.]